MERAGMGLLVGSGIALPVMGVLLMHGQPTMFWLLLLLSGGGVAGAMSSLLRRPSLIQVAVEVDRQLGLEELLSTSLLIGDSASPATMAVQAAGESCAAGLSRSALNFRRIGARGWSSVGLSLALVLTLAAFGTGSTALHGATLHPAENQSIASKMLVAEQPLIDLSLAYRRVPGSQDPDDSHSSRSGQAETPLPQKENQTEAPRSSERPSAQGIAGQGAGMSQNTLKQEDAALHTVPADAVVPRPSERGHLASGPGVSTGDTPPATGTHNTASASSAGGSPVTSPPWQSSAWPKQVETAQRSLSAGEVPASYADLIRNYFH
jgi:hypothetical protein